VVVHPFGSTPYQWWLAERVPALAEALPEDTGAVVVVGGPETRGRLREMTAAVDTTGAFDIPELLAVLEGARLVVSTDSGPFHMAGALGRPLVGLFRSRRPEHAQRYGESNVIFGHDTICERECRWDRCTQCPCREMRAITGDELAQAMRTALACLKPALQSSPLEYSSP
jgi:ADP-heptose:LPS heptosyltransferase